MWKKAVYNFRSAFFNASCSARGVRNRVWVPKFRLLRQMQPWDGPLDMEFMKPGTENQTVSEIRQYMRRNGLLPPPVFFDRPINIGHTGQVSDPYVPPEGDGRSSLLSSKRASQELDNVFRKGKSYLAGNKIRSYEPSFNPKLFSNEAEKIYIAAHNLIQNFTKNEEGLLGLITEKALSEMISDLKLKTLYWKFLGNIEPPRVVHIRTQSLLSKEDMYGQVTVRFYSQQLMAIYNRFGRLLYGNEVVPVDILEYAVFEKHLTDEYGIWRLHSKILPLNHAPCGNSLITSRLEPKPMEQNGDEMAVSNNEDVNFSKN